MNLKYFFKITFIFSGLISSIIAISDIELQYMLKKGMESNSEVHWLIKSDDLTTAIQLINAGSIFSGAIEGAQDAFTYVSTRYNKMTEGSSKAIHFNLLYTMVKRGYDIRANFRNENLVNNAWYQAIINNQSTHIGYFLGWGGTFKDNPYPMLAVADPNQVFILPDGSSWSPLFKAIESYDKDRIDIPGGSMSTIVYLLKSGADVNAKCEIYKHRIYSPLSYAFMKNDPSLINQLVNNGANITEAIQLFIKNGGNKESFLKTMWQGNWSLLGLALYYKDQQAVQFLLKEKVDINQLINPYPAHQQARNGDTLASLRGPHTALFYASKQNDKDTILLLLDNGARGS